MLKLNFLKKTKRVFCVFNFRRINKAEQVEKYFGTGRVTKLTASNISFNMNEEKELEYIYITNPTKEEALIFMCKFNDITDFWEFEVVM